MQFVSDHVRRENYRMVLPMTDMTTHLFAEFGRELPAGRVAIPSAEHVYAARDKRGLVLLARKLGVGCPVSYMVSDAEQIEEVARRVQYPVVIKPRFSCLLCDGRWETGAVEYADSPDDLVAKYRAADARIPRPLVQEMVPGEGRGVFLLVWDGELKSAFCHRRLREKPPSGGVSVLRESTALDMPLVEQSFALLREIGWQGVAMVEFKLDARDRMPKLMEINGRFWGSLQLAIDAGLNFPLMLYRLAAGERVSPQVDYKVGVKSRWLLGDLDHLLIWLKHGANGNGSGSRLQACWDFLKFYAKDMHYEIERLDDLRPGWTEYKQYVRSLVGAGRKENLGAH